jgi:hypothetical protein
MPWPELVLFRWSWTYPRHMHEDWVPMSAGALVIGAMSLVFGSVLNPAEPGASSAETFRVVTEESARWQGMAVMYTLASVALTLGLPALLTLFDRRGRSVALVAVVVFSVGAIGTCGYAMLMVFFRALVVTGALDGGQLDDVIKDRGLALFLFGWVACFYGGALLIAVALLRAGTTPRWVPGLLVVFVVLLPVASHLGRVGAALQVMAFATACTGIAVNAVARANQAASARQPAF